MSDAAWKEERPVPTVVMPLEEWESRRRNHEAVVTERDRLRAVVRELVEALERAALELEQHELAWCAKDARAALARAREVLGT